ncbi:glycosyltransferase family 4 protein [Rhodopseudomonas sp. HC1]|uniref:glycosyltransferase n=1 Tax=Rhodopseudomonas infernalis TaxID=2897386 RepID=UPI001EE7E344|nr:glycosyltransferase family 4 protein [Rhodopseudomonas infernalis]MCG6205036.1 glycosyltransferase family 4 protein [Rhodopseudomonas infernalis]
MDKLIVVKSHSEIRPGGGGHAQRPSDGLPVARPPIAAQAPPTPASQRPNTDELISRRLHDAATRLSAAQRELARVSHERDVLFGELLQARRAAKGAKGDTALAVRRLLPLLDWAVAHRSSPLFGAGRKMRLRLTSMLDSISRDVDAIEAYVREYTKFRGCAESLRLRILQTCMEIGSDLQELPLFSAVDYSALYPDVAASGLSPLSHFVTRGRAEDRTIHPLLDHEFYRATHPEVTAFGMSPSLHYIHFGAQKGFDPHQLFDSKSYLERYPDVCSSGITPLEHYVRNPLCNPHPLFDSAFYLRQNPDVMEAGLNPLVHFALFGGREGRRPHPLFHSDYYLAVNADVAAAGMNPLVHYLAYGWKENRDPNPELYGQLLKHGSDRRNPLLEYIAKGTASPTTQTRSLPATRTRDRGAPRILMIDALFPRPEQDSGSLDQIGFMRIFISLGFRVFFCAKWEFGGNPEREQELRALGVECVSSSEFRNLDEFLFFHGNSISAFFVSRVTMMENCYESLREFCPHSPIIFNTVDIHHLREQREAALRLDHELARRALDTRAKEIGFIESADLTIVVSEREAEILSQQLSGANVVTIPLIREWATEAVPDFDGRSGVCFIGGFAHKPNVDAVDYFIKSIWPLVLERQPDMQFYIVGSNMPPRLRDLDVPGVVAVGFVEDLSTWLRAVRVSVAPLRYGAGAKGKIVSSIGLGVPCVTTVIGAEGMGLIHDDTILVASSDQIFAEQVLSLHNDRACWQRLSQAGMAFIREKYSLEAGREIVKSSLRQLGVRLPGNLGSAVAGRQNV